MPGFHAVEQAGPREHFKQGVNRGLADLDVLVGFASGKRDRTSAALEAGRSVMKDAPHLPGRGGSSGSDMDIGSLSMG